MNRKDPFAFTEGLPQASRQNKAATVVAKTPISASKANVDVGKKKHEKVERTAKQKTPVHDDARDENGEGGGDEYYEDEAIFGNQTIATEAEVARRNVISTSAKNISGSKSTPNKVEQQSSSAMAPATPGKQNPVPPSAEPRHAAAPPRSATPPPSAASARTVVPESPARAPSARPQPQQQQQQQQQAKSQESILLERAELVKLAARLGEADDENEEDPQLDDLLQRVQLVRPCCPFLFCRSSPFIGLAEHQVAAGEPLRDAGRPKEEHGYRTCFSLSSRPTCFFA